MVKNLLAHEGDADSIPESGRSPEEGHDNSLQYSCLGNPMDRGAQQATVYRVTKSQTRLSAHDVSWAQAWPARLCLCHNSPTVVEQSMFSDVQ